MTTIRRNAHDRRMGIFVALLVLINVVGALWLLFATAKRLEKGRGARPVTSGTRT